MKELKEQLPLPMHYKIVGINRVKLNMSNLVPSLGFANRNGATLPIFHVTALFGAVNQLFIAGIVVGISGYSSLDSDRHNNCKMVRMGWVFLVGLDTFPMLFGAFVYLYGSLACDDQTGDSLLG